MSIIRIWIIVPLLHVILFCCCLWCFSVIVDWHPTILRDVSWLSTSVAYILRMLSFVSFPFAFVLLLSFVSKRTALSYWTFSIVVTFVAFSFALVSAVALSFSFAFTFVFSFSFVPFVSFAFDCWNVHWCLHLDLFLCLRMSVVSTCWMLLSLCSIPWLLFWLDCSLVFVQLRAEGVVVVVLLSHWGWLLFSLILEELVHCLVHTCWAQIPIVKMSPQSCSCRRWAWVVLSGILLTLFPLVLRTACIAVCRSHSHCLSDVVCILLLLLLSICWLGCTSSLSIVVSICLLHLLLKLLLQDLHLWLLLWSSLSVFSNNCGSALSISPMYAWNLYFHSSKVPYSPVNVGGCILYLCMLISPCAIVPSACCSPFAVLDIAIVVSYSSQVGAYCCTCVCAVVLFVAHLDCRTRIVCSATM